MRLPRRGSAPGCPRLDASVTPAPERVSVSTEEVTLSTDLLSLLRVRNGGEVADARNAHPLVADKYVLFEFVASGRSAG